MNTEKWIAVVVGVFVVGSAVCPWFLASLVFYALHECPRGVFYAVRQAFLHNAISEENKRATIGSISSFFEQAGSIAAYVACHGLLLSNSVSTVWVLSGAAAIVVSAVMYWRFIPETEN